jgi:hypothetical protein
MGNSSAIRISAWQLRIFLRIAFSALSASGVALLVLGKDCGIFLLMFGLLFGYAAMFRRCEACKKHVYIVGSFWLAYANPFTRRCLHCGHPIRKPHVA